MGSEFDLRAQGGTGSAMDFIPTPRAVSDLAVGITPLRKTQQEDSHSLDQTLTVGGLDHLLHIASVKPTTYGCQESAQCSRPPPGTYNLFLSRTETTGTRAQRGTATAGLALVEGVPSAGTLTVD